MFSAGRVIESAHWCVQRHHDALVAALRCVSLQVDGRPAVSTTASLFRDAKVADLFFKTDRCMRVEQTTCWPQGEYCPTAHVHAGL